MTLKKIFYLVVVLSIAAVAGLYISNKEKTAGKEDVIKIGVILPLSGNNAFIGQQLKQGLDLLKQTQTYSKKFTFIFEDDQMQATKTNLIAHKLAETDKVDVIITYASQPAAIVAPIAAKHNILQFANSSDPSFTRYPGNYAFAPSPEDEMRVLLREIKKRGYQKIALISAIEPYSNLAEKNIKKLAAQMNLDLVFEVKVNASDRDFKMLIAQAESKNPDIYILQTWEPTLDILVKQLKQAYPQKPFTAAYAFFLSQSPDLFEGQFCLNIGSNSDGYKKLFYDVYHKEPEQMSAVGYAEADLLLKTLSTMKNGDDFYQKLLEVAAAEDSVVGRLSVNGRQVNYRPIVQEFVNGQPVTVKE